MPAHLKLVASRSLDTRGSPREKAPRVLLAEDDVEMRRVIGDALRREGYEVVEATNGKELLGRLVRDQRSRVDRGRTIDLILTDVRLPGCDGLDILELLRGTDPRTPTIVMTAFGDRDTVARAKGLGAVMLNKPFPLDALMIAIRRCLR
jgi:DNA-binding response OmpR family regulator